MNCWSHEKEDLLKKYYGVHDTSRLCGILGVTYKSLRGKANRMGLGYQREADELVTMRQVREMLNIQHYTITRFIKAGFPVKKKKFGDKNSKRYNIVIPFEDLLEWLQLHPDMWSAAKVKYRALGVEPDWLKEKRRKDASRICTGIL